jgi:hypothetical protein
MSKPDAAAKRRGYEYLGTTSDGVRVIKPRVGGRRNLTDAQIRMIVERLLEATGRGRKSRTAAE